MLDISLPPGIHFNMYDERELGQSDFGGMSAMGTVDHRLSGSRRGGEL